MSLSKVKIDSSAQYSLIQSYDTRLLEAGIVGLDIPLDHDTFTDLIQYNNDAMATHMNDELIGRIATLVYKAQGSKSFESYMRIGVGEYHIVKADNSIYYTDQNDATALALRKEHAVGDATKILLTKEGVDEELATGFEDRKNNLLDFKSVQLMMMTIISPEGNQSPSVLHTSTRYPHKSISSSISIKSDVLTQLNEYELDIDEQGFLIHNKSGRVLGNVAEQNLKANASLGAKGKIILFGRQL